MAVGRNRQAIAATQAATLQHLPSISRCHPGTETMHANTAANFGLVCPFGHIVFLSLLIFATVSCANCQTQLVAWRFPQCTGDCDQ
jgi:hypothetical protein